MSAEVISLERRRLKQRIERGLAENPVRPGMVLISATQLSHKIGRSTKSIRRDRQAGMPAYKIGQGFRYDLEAVLAWYEERDAA